MIECTGVVSYDLMLNVTFWGLIFLVFILSYFIGYFSGYLKGKHNITKFKEM